MTNKPAIDVQSNERRTLLKNLTTTAAITSVALASTPFAAMASEKKTSSNVSSNSHPLQSVIDSCADCSKVGDICLDHCISLISEDDTTIASCLVAVRNMLPVVNSTTILASSESDHFVAQAEVCKAVCDSCRIECEKHAHHHPECKICMESCEACIEELEKVLAA